MNDEAATTADPQETDPAGPPPARPAILPRLLMLVVLVSLAAAVCYFLFATPQGRKWRNPKYAHQHALEWVALHPVAAPAVLVGVYVLFGTLLLPVWPLQVLAGYSFGLVKGLLWVQVGATYAAVASLAISRWLIGEWFLRRFGQRMGRLKRVEEKLGHNGLLVVMAVRLSHLMPFGISNYLFGLTRITVLDAAIGTFWAGTSTSAFYVAMGNDRHSIERGTFWAAWGALNLVLVIPLGVRYLKPQWFKRIGIE